MAILLNTEEKALCDILANEIDTINAEGLEAPAGFPYAVGTVPIENYREIIQIGSKPQIDALNGIRAGFAALIRQLKPIAYSNVVTDVNPPKAFTSATTISSLVLPVDMSISRTVIVSVNFSAFSTSTYTGIEYWLEINGGSPTAHSLFYFNDGNAHHQISQTWSVTLPVGAVSIALRVARYSGIGTITLDTNDSIGISLFG